MATIKLIKLIKQAQYHELDLLGLLNSYGLIWLDCIHSSKQIKLIKRACLLPTMPAGQNQYIARYEGMSLGDTNANGK
jgi:hypothetical protein